MSLILNTLIIYVEQLSTFTLETTKIDNFWTKNLISDTVGTAMKI
jgi:hypothetical protein